VCTPSISIQEPFAQGDHGPEATVPTTLAFVFHIGPTYRAYLSVTRNAVPAQEMSLNLIEIVVLSHRACQGIAEDYRSDLCRTISWQIGSLGGT